MTDENNKTNNDNEKLSFTQSLRKEGLIKGSSNEKSETVPTSDKKVETKINEDITKKVEETKEEPTKEIQKTETKTSNSNNSALLIAIVLIIIIIILLLLVMH